ncbi:MAG TPA: hypothetical protein VGE40_05975, partial [Bacilli bacterium]
MIKRKIGFKEYVWSLVILLLLTIVFTIIKVVAVSPSNSTFFATTYVESYSTYSTSSDGDLWASCWSNDDYLYSINGDGKGFFMNPPMNWNDIVVNRVSGMPGNITGTRIADNVSQVWADPAKYNRKPTGMVCVNGDLYVAVQDLNKEASIGGWTVNKAFNDAPNATIAKSTDKGLTWTWNTTTPMFNNYVFTTIMFLDYGKDNANAIDGYVYAYGLDYNWRDSFSNTVTDPTKLYLARVPKTSIMDRTTWQFFKGNDTNGNPTWSSDIGLRAAVLEDDKRIYQDSRDVDNPSNFTILSQGSIVYNQPLNRYIYSSWSEYTFEFYEAPNPWGPWKHFMTKDYGGYPWHTDKNGGYATTIPSKFISVDGKTMWIQSNTFEGGTTNYSFTLRKLILEPFVDSTPSNVKDNFANLGVSGQGVRPIEKVAHYGHPEYLNNGITNQTEDSWDQENKLTDWWGYTWTKKYNLNKVVYTTGDMFSNGGWYSSNLKVQVRQNFQWVDVAGLGVSPAYPYNNTAGPYKIYTFTFSDTWGDGVRIIGEPAAPTAGIRFTSIAELEAYYANDKIHDNFNGPLAGDWTWSVPLSGPTYEFAAGNWRLKVPNSNMYDNWTTVDNNPKITRTDMGTGDWSLQTKLKLTSYTANKKFHTGLTVKFGNNDYLLFGNAKGNSIEFNRTGVTAFGVASYSNTTVFLKLSKVSSTYTAYYK